MTEDARELVRLLQQQEREVVRTSHPPGHPEPPSIHYTQLDEPIPGSPIAAEWDLYRREVGRLLAQGHEGRWVLIKGGTIVGIWDTEQEADQARLRGFLMQPVLLKQILTWEPVLRGGGYDRRWPS
jgi:hypothetical protein